MRWRYFWMMEKARDYSLATRGTEDLDSIKAMLALAVIYSAAGRNEEALKMQEEVLTLRRKVSGPEHPDTLMAMNNLAVIYFAAGRNNDALKLTEEVLTLFRKVNGPEHPDTLGAMTNLAQAYGETGRLAEAIPLQEQALTIKRRVLPKDHPFLAIAMANLADLYAKSGRTAEAIQQYEELLVLRRQVLGAAHPDTLAAMHNLGVVHLKAGRLDELTKVIAEQIEYLRRAGKGPDLEPALTLQNQLAARAAELTKGPAQEDAIARYYADHQDAFLESSVHLHMITIKREAGKEARAEQRQKVEALRQKIADGTPFAAVAREYSETDYGKDGGDRGTVDRGDLREDLDKAIFTVKQGTPVIHEDEDYLWIFQVDDRKEGQMAPLEKVREKVSNILREQKRAELLQQWQQDARKKVELEAPAEQP